ncbi:TOBE domain-containing protein, partial [Actinokineospora pegani]|uniref:TOBE domain-containing protein n=1 Tax=Actinokineospora pegani TaxID=2654637 RepID=UPI0012EA8584
RPANAFVAGFIGSPAMNLVEVPVTSAGVTLGGIGLELPRETNTAVAEAGVERVTLGVRPESLALVPSGAGEGFELVVELVEELGADALVHGSVRGSDERLVMRVDGRTPPALAQTVAVAVRDAGELHVFHPETGERLV